MLGVEAFDFVQLDIGILGPLHGSAGGPPLSAGKACGQVCASPGIIVLLGPAPLGGNFAMGRLPEPDRARVAAQHNGVVPAPDHHGGDARRPGHGYQMTRQHPLPPRRRKLRCVPDGYHLPRGQNLAGILPGIEHDAAPQPRRAQGTWGRNSHSSSMPRRTHGSPVFSWRAAAGDLTANSSDKAAERAASTGNGRLACAGQNKSIEKLMEYGGRSARDRFIRVEIRAYPQSSVGRIHSDDVGQQAEVIDIAGPGRPCLYCRAGRLADLALQTA